MSPLEYLLLIFVIVETVQVYFLLRNTRQLRVMVHGIITDEEYAATVAKNMIFGLMEDIKDDEEKQEIFFGFVGACAVQGVAHVKNYLGTPAAGIQPDLKGVPPIIKGLVKGANALGIDVGAIVQQKVTKTAKAAVEGAAEELVPGW